MPAHERTVAGLKCSDVLAVLSDYIDGTLDAATRSHVEDHLRGCDWCEKFGGRFTDVVQALRKNLETPKPLSADVAERLRRRLRQR
jgi:anti-sigma factor RsiW